MDSMIPFINGEEFVVSNRSKDEPLLLSDDEINEKYKKGEIRIITEQARYPLDTIQALIDSDKYNRNPEYQRRKRWSVIRKSRLIESYIMNVPIPPIFLYEVEYASYEVMDGLQRLTAIYDFYTGKYSLEGLQYWQELNGKKYKELPEHVRKGIDRRYLSSIVLLQETAKNKEEADFLKQIVFERLNSGGEKLTPQETRNALYNGVFNKLCIRLAANDCFRKMWKIPLESDGEEKLLENEQYKKMEDVELVLRFFAYRHIENLKGMTVEIFLDEFLKQANKRSPNTLVLLENLFNDTIDLVYTIFKDKAFLLPSIKSVVYNTPTKTIYDPLMQAFARNIKHKTILIKNAKDIKNNLFKNKDLLYTDINKEKYIFDGRYNNRADVELRIKYFDNFLFDYI